MDVGNVSARHKGIRGFESALLRCELAQDGARGFGSALLRCELTQNRASGFGIGKGYSGMVLKTREWCGTVGIG